MKKNIMDQSKLIIKIPILKVLNDITILVCRNYFKTKMFIPNISLLLAEPSLPGVTATVVGKFEIRVGIFIYP